MGKQKEHRLAHETKRSILIILLFVFALIFALSLFGSAGIVGEVVNSILLHIFGWSRYVVPIVILVFAFFIHKGKAQQVGVLTYIGLFMFVLSLSGLLHIGIETALRWDSIAFGKGGGYIGYLGVLILNGLLGFWVSLIVLIALLIISVLLVVNKSLSQLIGKFIPSFGKSDHGTTSFKQGSVEDEYEDEEYEEDEDEEYEDEEEDDDEGDDEPEEYEEEDDDEDEMVPKTNVNMQKIDLPFDLLRKQSGKPTGDDIKRGKVRIQKTLENFGINVEMGEVKVGPTVTQYTLKPADGIKLSKITALADNLSLALSAHPLRIEAPIPGKPLVGIEVPNKQVAVVTVREILESKEYKTRGSNMMVCLGKDVSGKPWVVDIAKMPHLLVAGATGSGKSVCLNSIIVSLLYQNSPETLRLIMVDPKRVELPVYNGIPHLLTPVITDVQKTVNALKWAISEMDRRFDILSQAGKRDIISYNQKAEEPLPYIVICIDELADLMITAAAEVESAIIRLTQMARAVGIHLILATQRPSVDVITGLIKANVPARIAFSVASLIDSRTILDSPGAEKLLGKGDMLFVTADLGKPRRIQGAYLGDDEIKKVVRYLKDALELPVEYDEEIVEKQKSSVGSFDLDHDDGDELLEDAREVVIHAGKASASLLQRRLRVGYARAARLLDLLEDQGVIGPSMGSKPREILVDISEE